MKRTDSFTPFQKKCISLTAFGVFLLLSGCVCWFIGRPMLAFVSEPERFRSWVDAHGLMGRLAFIGMMILQVVVAIIPGEPLEIGAGYAFGFWEGTGLCMAGILLGSLLVFGIVRRFGVRLVEVFFSREKIDSLKFLQDARRRDFIIFLVFFLPGTPKDLLSYFVGLTKIRLSHWLLIAGVARIPSVVTSTIGGDALGMQNYVFAIVVFVATLAISGLGLLCYRLLCKKMEHRHAAKVQKKLQTGQKPTA